MRKELNIIEKALKNGLLTPDEAYYLIEDLKFEERKKDVLAWGRYYFPDKFDLEFCEELHNYLIDIRKELRAATYAPRGHAKTTIKSFLVKIYQAYNEPTEFKHYLSIQSKTEKAIAVNLSIRKEIEENKLLYNDYGGMISDYKWTEKQFVLKNGIIFTAIGAGESMRGINYNNIRPDYIDVDDLYDEEDINHIQRINKKSKWFWGSLYNSISRTNKKACIHVQGTAIANNDIIISLSKNKKWKFKKFQAIKNYEKKEALWPLNISFDELYSLRHEPFPRGMGSIIFDREYQNNCRDDATSIIKEHEVKFVPELPLQEGEEIIQTIGGCDPAIGEKEINDYIAIASAYKTNFDNYFFFQISNSHFSEFSFEKTKQKIKSLNEIYSYDIFRVEAISAFQYLTQEIKRTTGVRLKEIKHVPNKITHLESHQSKFENGKVFFSSKLPDDIKEELKNQLINNFPEHDDIRDAILLCLRDDKKPNLRIMTA
ncbi:MAG: hypothetical protein ACFFE4_00540 [Candidatus Thorarchaeota archaeon]